MVQVRGPHSNVEYLFGFVFFANIGQYLRSLSIGTSLTCTHAQLPSDVILFFFKNSFQASECGGSGSGSSNGAEKAEGDAGPSCSSLSKDASDGKSRFFDDSEESEEGEEEEGSDEEVIILHQLEASQCGVIGCRCATNLSFTVQLGRQ